MENNLVSIIMPMYNTGAMSSESIDSIIAQTYTDWELIIVDDNSDDEMTLSILERYSKADRRINIIYLDENKGAGFARNKGYGTREHIAALREYGPCPIHRRSFIGKFL